MDSIKAYDQQCLTSGFAAACRPVLSLREDAEGLFPVLRLTCKDVRAVADAERKQIQVALPADPSAEGLLPQHLCSLLSRLPALAHAVISQELHSGPACHSSRAHAAPPLPNPAAAHHHSSTAAHASSSSAPLYWRSVLSSLRPLHLRSLELDGLVLELPCPYALTSAAGTPLLGLGAAVTGATGAAATPPPLGPHRCSTADLLAALLRAAPGLQELALMRVEVEVEVGVVPGDEGGKGDGPHSSPRSAAAAGTAVAPAGSSSDAWQVAVLNRAKSGQPQSSRAAAGAGAWCAVLSALPRSLRTLRLSFSPASLQQSGGTITAAADPHCSEHGGCPMQRHHHHHAGQPCPACLGSALRRLGLLTSLELSGLTAQAAMSVLQAATGLTDARPNAGRITHDTAAATAAAAAGSSTVFLPCGQRPAQQYRYEQGHLASPQAPLPLERLQLDVEGPLDLAAVRAVAAAALPQLRSLTLLEQACDSTSPAPVRPVMPPARSAHGPSAAAAQRVQEARRVVEKAQEPAEQPTCFQPLDSMLRLLSHPGLRSVSFTSDRAFTTLARPLGALPAASCAVGASSSKQNRSAAAGVPLPAMPGQRGATVPAEAAVGSAGGAGGASPGSRTDNGHSGEGAAGVNGAQGVPVCLSSVRLSLDLSAEALEPLVSSLPPSLASLTLNVGTLHRPADVLAAYAAAAAPPPPPPSVPLPPHHAGSAPAPAAAVLPQQAASQLPASPDSAAWLSIPPHSFLGGLRFTWPALTRLPRLLPRLRELRLGGGAAAACGDHVLRCWAGASGHPDSFATPMVADPAFNAMLLSPRGGGGGGNGASGGGGGGEEVAAPLPLRGGGDVGDVGAWSEWSRSLERVCLTAPGPTVAAALHLRRFMPALRRLQVVVEGRLTDVMLPGGRERPGWSR